MRTKKLGEELEVGDICELPKGDTGKVLSITESGIEVHNYDEERRARNAAWKLKRCDYCKSKISMIGLFFEEDDKRYKCKGCINSEIRKEKNIITSNS